MALRRTLAKRLNKRNRDASPLVTLEHSPIMCPAFHNTSVPITNATTTTNFLASPENSENTGIFRRFFQRRRINQSSSTARLPEFFSFPVGEKLREKLNNISGDRVRLDGLIPVLHDPAPVDSAGGRITVQDARKILRSSQLEKLRSALKKLPENSITYSEFVQICSDIGSNRDQGLEFAKMLDESGNVIVLGNVVFLRPELVAKSMEKLISQSIAMPKDPRKQELKEMEKEKAVIDRKAESLVRGELYCGLGFLIVQTLGFMRLTFWEFSWDVMEPICFFVTSFHFALAYVFFLRTAKEPSFESYFQRRFRVKQRKLMETNNFDIEKYNQLCNAFYPNYTGFPASGPSHAHAHANGHRGNTVFG